MPILVASQAITLLQKIQIIFLGFLYAMYSQGAYYIKYYYQIPVTILTWRL